MTGTDPRQPTVDAMSSSTQQASPIQKPRFSIVIPCRDEEENIAPLVAEICEVVGNRSDIEVIIVDDGSADGTRDRILRARLQMPLPVRIIAHSRNLGQSAGLCTGIDAARGDWIVTMDGDGQNDPRDVVKFIDWLETQGVDTDIVIVCGHRQKRHDTWIRRLSSKVANGVRARVLGDATPDTGCGLKLIRRDTFQTLPRFDHMHRFLPALAQRTGGQIVSVEVRHRPRVRGESKYGVHNRLWVGIIDMFGVLWLKRRSFKESAIEEL